MDRAKVFTIGSSQAVRLPDAYRFETDEVFIERTQDGVLLRPAPSEPLGQRLLAILGEHDSVWLERDQEPELQAAGKPAKGAGTAKKKPAAKGPGRGCS